MDSGDDNADAEDAWALIGEKLSAVGLVEHELKEAKAVNVELTTKIGTLNARIDELTAKPEEPPREQSAPEARCPECGGNAIRLGGFQPPGKSSGEWTCEKRCTLICAGRIRHFWRRWGDTDKAAGAYWLPLTVGAGVVLASDSSTYSNPGTAGAYPMSDCAWVLGPLPEPKAPGGE